jgi:hypothetical protein
LCFQLRLWRGRCLLVEQPAWASTTATLPFASTGAEQTFTVPARVTSVHVVAVGGSGGTAFGPLASAGGFGRWVQRRRDRGHRGWRRRRLRYIRTVPAAASGSLNSRLLVAAGGGGGGEFGFLNTTAAGKRQKIVLRTA